MSRTSLDLDIAGIGLRFEGISASDAVRLERIWQGFVVHDLATPACTVAVEELDRVMTPGSSMPGAFHAEPSGSGMRYFRDEGEILVEGRGDRATLRIARGDAERRAWTFVNLLGALLGFLLPGRRGGALHAAGIVLDGRAFVLVGPEGSGKTTFAAAAASVSVPVLSDDVILVDNGNGRLEALSAPIRDLDFPGPGPGRWPVAAVLLGRRGSPARLEPVTRLILESRLAANLLYAAHAWKSSPRIASALEAIADGAPARMLTFSAEPSYLALLKTFSS